MDNRLTQIEDEYHMPEWEGTLPPPEILKEPKDYFLEIPGFGYLWFESEDNRTRWSRGYELGWQQIRVGSEEAVENGDQLFVRGHAFAWRLATYLGCIGVDPSGAGPCWWPGRMWGGKQMIPRLRHV